MKKSLIFIFALVVILVPTFFNMIKPGIFSTQDFHFFRLLEFDKCIQNFQIPCRWAPDAGLGYGEPLFNFYTQLPYVVGEVFHLTGFNIIDSLKISFTLSLVFSGLSMYILSERIWKSKFAAIISSVVYVYAPYRAVDVWVRGALPEAVSFVFFPLVIYFLDLAINEKGIRNKLLLGLMLGLTLLTHNLSLLMFIPFLVIWTTYRLIESRRIKIAPLLLISVSVAISLSAFYILPVVFESRYIDLDSTTRGYFDFRAHFATVSQLLISRFWGYGGSTWGEEDGLSLSIGQIQWIIPVIIFVLISFKKKINDHKQFLVLFAIGWSYLFLSHNKSAFIWEAVPFLKYLQFPWRFLSMALFAFSLASGVVANLFNKTSIKVLLSISIIVVTIFINFSFFKEDIWYNYSDKDLTSGDNWTLQRTASIGDFWPQFGHKIPDKPSNGEFINYFPGWKVKDDGFYVDAKPNSDGLIRAKDTIFSNTPIRTVGNLVSLASIIGLVFLYVKKYKINEK